MVRYLYFDKNDVEIKAGMTLLHDTGEEIVVHACSDVNGNQDLGFLATNPAFLERHPDWPTEYYSLSQVNLSEWQIVG